MLVKYLLIGFIKKDKDMNLLPHRMSNPPLVSIVVLTYNSAKYILETLESARKQTYQQIELIITDDSSNDDTLAICQKWVECNRPYFRRIEIVTSVINTGIPANCNRGLASAEGEWIKLIAGDDILTDNCIESYIAFCGGEAEIKATCAQFFTFINEYSPSGLQTPSYFGYKNFYSEKNSAEGQFETLLRRNFLHGPTLFVRRDLLETLGGFDERYQFEDLPLALKITSLGVKLHFLGEVTVYYRIHNASITASNSKEKLFSRFYIARYKFDKEYVFKHANFVIRIMKMYEYYRLHTLDKLGLNRNNLFCRTIFRITYLLNPLNTYNLYF